MKKESQKKITTQLRLPPALHKELKKLGLTGYCSQNQLIIYAISDYLKKNKRLADTLK